MRLNELQPETNPLLVSPINLNKFKSGREAKISTTTAFYLLRFNVSLQIAVLAITINLLLAVFTFYYGLNALYCAFGIDCVIGVITSSILVWRFASSKQEELLEKIYLIRKQGTRSQTTAIYANATQFDLFDSTIETNDPEDHVRELWSTFWLGQVMIVSGFGIIVRTIIELVSHALHAKSNPTFVDFETLFDDPKAAEMAPLVTLALISLGLNLMLMFFKIFIYYYLGSNSMLIEGVNSLISALFASMAVVSIQFSSCLAFLDQTVSILFGVFLIVYGVFNVAHTIGQTVYANFKRNPTEYTLVV